MAEARVTPRVTLVDPIKEFLKEVANVGGNKFGNFYVNGTVLVGAIMASADRMYAIRPDTTSGVVKRVNVKLDNGAEITIGVNRGHETIPIRYAHTIGDAALGADGVIYEWNNAIDVVRWFNQCLTQSADIAARMK